MPRTYCACGQSFYVYGNLTHCTYCGRKLKGE